MVVEIMMIGLFHQQCLWLVHKVLKWWDVVESASYPNNFDVYVFPGGFTGDASTGVNLRFVCLYKHRIDSTLS